MPNYIITTKANFKPFSYAELLAPVASATKAHRELEDAYSDLGSEASVWEKLANSEPDKDVYNVYKNYSNDLQAQADKLAKEGLTPNSRRDLLNMKRRYSSDIKPIEEAWAKREADIKEYKTLAKDPTLLSGDSNPMNASLTSYMNGNTPTYRYLSGEDLYKQGLTAATALSKGKYNESKPVLDAGRQYWKMVTEQGYSPDEAAQWLANNGAFPEITAEVNRIKEAYNTAGLGSNSAAADSQIIRGIMDGLHAGYTKDVDRQRYIAPKDTDASNSGFKTVTFSDGTKGAMYGSKIYKLNPEGQILLDDTGKPVTVDVSSKDDEDDSTSSLFKPLSDKAQNIVLKSTKHSNKKNYLPIAEALKYGTHIGNVINTYDNSWRGSKPYKGRYNEEGEDIEYVTGNADSPLSTPSGNNIMFRAGETYGVEKDGVMLDAETAKNTLKNEHLITEDGKYIYINKHNIIGKTLLSRGIKTPEENEKNIKLTNKEFDNLINGSLFVLAHDAYEGGKREGKTDYSIWYFDEDKIMASAPASE